MAPPGFRYGNPFVIENICQEQYRSLTGLTEILGGCHVVRKAGSSRRNFLLGAAPAIAGGVALRC